MTADDPLRDDEIATVRGEEPTDADPADAIPSGATDTGVMMDAADTGTVDRTDVGADEDADAGGPDR